MDHAGSDQRFLKGFYDLQQAIFKALNIIQEPELLNGKEYATSEGAATSRAPIQAGAINTYLAVENNSELGLEQIFKFIDNNFDKFRCEHNLAVVRPLLHRVVQADANANYINKFVCSLVQRHKDEEPDLNIALHIIYQILKTITTTRNTELQPAIGSEVFLELIDELFADNKPQTAANILACIQLYLRQNNTNTDIIWKLWAFITKTTPNNANAWQRYAQILVQLFDQFVLNIPNFDKSNQLVWFIQELLVSAERDQRKAAYFLMKKVMAAVIERNVSPWEVDHSKEFRQRWTTYISIVENLESNQSHLILPALEMLQIIEQPTNESWDKWINILYQKILCHNNVLINQWALEHLLKTYVGTKTSPVLLQILEASNRTGLYNCEGYFLSQQFLDIFITNERIQILFELLLKVNWKPVPLHFWLTHLTAKNEQLVFKVPFELVLKIATRVRTLQNINIRKKLINLVENMIVKIIDDITVSDYVSFIETLYNIGDICTIIKYFTPKLKQWKDHDETASFSERFYKIISSNLLTLGNGIIDIELILEIIADVPKERHDWLRFLIVFDLNTLSEKAIEFIRLNYDIDMNLLTSEAPLADITTELSNKLACDQSELRFVREKSVDFYVKHQLKTSSDFSSKSDTVHLVELLEMGTFYTFSHLVHILKEYEGDLSAEEINAFIQTVKKYKNIDKHSIFFSDHISKLLLYCKRTQSTEMSRKYAETILNIDLFNRNVCFVVISSGIILSKESYFQGILLGEAKTGDARIEEVYEDKVLEMKSPLTLIRRYYTDYIPKKYIQSTTIDLLTLNNELSMKKPRYFKNSHVHRLKTRIAICMISLLKKDVKLNSKDLWVVLLKQNNQLDVTYMYELLTAKFTTSINEIFDKLEGVADYKPSQQVSIISVTHCYCIMNWEILQETQLSEIIQTLLPLTMGANFQTRLYAQLVVLSILEKCVLSGINIHCRDVIIKAIKDTCSEKLSELMEDVRLKLPFLYANYYPHEIPSIILYISHAPYDEDNCIYCPNFSEFEKSRSLFENRQKSPANDVTEPLKNKENANVINVQRKMTPTDDYSLKHELISYPDCGEKKIYIVASLVDKLPNLGGIARTCEVLGIQNLVVDSKEHVTKADFKNLSMTAEKTLNIIEIKAAALTDFLMEKRSEGYKIIGAEQTDNSSSFVNFKFPEKCILLLGHEKEGIPSNLLGFLDYAVEIPQFGLVRSLNVHVTGALFMWEYCKQHIVGK